MYPSMQGGVYPLGRHPSWADTPFADTPWAHTTQADPPETASEAGSAHLLECILFDQYVKHFISSNYLMTVMQDRPNKFKL